MRKSFLQSSWSRKAAIGSILTALCLGFALTACDDSSSAGDDDNNVILSSDSREESSDSRSNDKDEAISSSGKVTDKDSEPAEGSSSSVESSDSKSSSSVKSGDSSSSSSAGKVESSSSLGRFDWNLPKEAFLNSEIDYDTLIDSRDGKVYRTVKIGDQVWMAENLNYDDSVATPSLIGKSWCYENDSKNCDVAGRLYIWAAAIDSVKLYDSGRDCGYRKSCKLPAKMQGICPNGWHLPRYIEWNTLQSKAGMVLKSQTGWYSNGSGTDAYGFSALPAGYGYDDGRFFNAGSNAYFWSATDYNGGNAYCMYLNYDGDGAHLYYDAKFGGYSVRCVKDSD